MTSKPISISLCLLLGGLLISTPVPAKIDSWRKDGSGKFLAERIPFDWQNSALWKTPLESESNGSPILVEGRLFFSAEPADLICADARTGEILWKRSNTFLDLLDLSESEIEQVELNLERVREIDAEVGRLRIQRNRIERRIRKNDGLKTEEDAKAIEDFRIKVGALNKEREAIKNDPNIGKAILPRTHGSNGYSSYTPVSDGKQVFQSFGLGVVVAYDFFGNRLWHRIMEEPDPEIQIGGSSSPLLVDGKLIVRLSDYTALNPENGEEIWRTPCKIHYGTAIPFRVENQSFLFAPTGEVIRVSDGKLIQSDLVTIPKSRRFSTFSSPVIEGNAIYTIRGYNGGEGHAYRFLIPDNLQRLESAGLKLDWHKRIMNTRYYSSPIAHQGLLYMITEEYVFIALDAETGETVYERKLEDLKGVSYTSLCMTSDAIFCASEHGVVVALKPGIEFEELGRSRIGSFRSTPIFSQDVVYVRTFDSLLAIGTP